MHRLKSIQIFLHLKLDAHMTFPAAAQGDEKEPTGVKKFLAVPDTNLLIGRYD
jgi:hypothetical protein